MRYISFIIFVLCLSACSYTKKINNGQVAYDSKKYALAIPLLEKEYSRSKDELVKGQKAYKLGKSFYYTNDNLSSLKWFQIASNHEFGSPALKELAFAYKREEQYKNAINTFEQLERDFGKDQLITREINICRQALNWLNPKTGTSVEINPLSGNSEYSDYSPQLYRKDYLVFTSDRFPPSDGSTYDWTGNAYSNIYIQGKNNGEVELFDPGINTDKNEGTICFSLDSKEAYFTRCFTEIEGLENEYCKIFHSVYESDQWSEPQLLSFQEEKRNYGHPALIENDSVLVFAVQEIDGSETHDLYYSVREENGFLTAEPMPTSINTDGNEKFPTGDGDTLYYSSDFLPGLGGLDIFKTYLRRNGSWAPPQNLKAPFNSGGDDFGLIIDRFASSDARDYLREGYFCSNRNPNSGDDLYRFVVRKTAPPVSEEPETEIEEPADFKVYLAGRVVYNEYSIPDDPSSKITGKMPLQNAKVSIVSRDQKIEIKTDEKGRFIQEVGKEQDFDLLASKDDYLNAKASTSSRGKKPKAGDKAITLNVELALDKLELNKEIVMENIYYDFDKFYIREDAQPSLDRLVEILKNNGDLNIELASHTDCEGNNAYNQNLSQKRAQAAVNYLILKGIESTRLAAQGYGESRPSINCECKSCTDDQNQANRRTTFKLSKG